MSQPSNDELLRYIQQYQFLISEVSHALRKEAYSFQLDYGILPNSKIELLVSLPDKVDRKAKQHIEETILDVIKANELNPISFQITLKISMSQQQRFQLGLVIMMSWPIYLRRCLHKILAPSALTIV